MHRNLLAAATIVLLSLAHPVPALAAAPIATKFLLIGHAVPTETHRTDLFRTHETLDIHATYLWHRATTLQYGVRLAYLGLGSKSFGSTDATPSGSSTQHYLAFQGSFLAILKPISSADNILVSLGPSLSTVHYVTWTSPDGDVPWKTRTGAAATLTVFGSGSPALGLEATIQTIFRGNGPAYDRNLEIFSLAFGVGF
jgi:hypothetical protein